MKLTLIRNATVVLEVDGRRLLVDPMLDPAGFRPPVENTPNPRRNPLVELPMPAEDVVRNIDAVLLTHLHRDHFDDTAARLLPRDVPVFCQPEDAATLAGHGLRATPVDRQVDWDGIGIVRTGARHGSGAVADMLGPVSGYVVGDLYLAGDTVWCGEVERAIAEHRPRVAVVNGGGARFVDSDPIVMTTADIAQVAQRVGTVVVVHLEAINHCLETRAEVRAAVPDALVPDDGATLDLAARAG